MNYTPAGYFSNSDDENDDEMLCGISPINNCQITQNQLNQNELPSSRFDNNKSCLPSQNFNLNDSKSCSAKAQNYQPNMVSYLNPDDLLLFNDLRKAIQNSNIKVIEDFLDRGMDLEMALGSNGMTALFYASAYAQPDSLLFLLSNGAHYDGYRLEELSTIFGILANKKDLLLKKEECIKIFKQFNIHIINYSSQKTSGQVDDDGITIDVISSKEPETSHIEISSLMNNVDNFKKFFSYDETGSFLANHGLHHLLPKFKDISFIDFLKFTETDLMKIGITQLGLQKKILKSIDQFHLCPFANTCLPAIDYSERVTGSEAVCLLGNIEKQFAYIDSSFKYASNALKSNLEEYKQFKPGEEMLIDISLKLKEAEKNLTNFKKEVLLYRSRFHKVCEDRDFYPVDFIKNSSNHLEELTSNNKLDIFFSLTKIIFKFSFPLLIVLYFHQKRFLF